MTTSTLLMIRPAAFAFNPQTAVNNSFQKINEQLHVHEKALLEFDNFVNILNVYGIKVFVIQDTLEPHTPDSVFPNNWVSFHEDGTVVLYPMFADNRKLERNKNILEKLNDTFFIRSTIDLTEYEQKNAYLEGTGSMVLDRDHEIAYACLSPRTNASVLYDFCDSIGYSPVLFNAVDENDKEIYHTNVMMCMADSYVVVCFQSIKDQLQRQMLADKFKETGKEIIEITLQQMNHFAGNMLQVENIAGNQFLIMSTQAYNSLTEEQINLLTSFNPIIHSSLHTIEQNGGGSARCMMAEIFLPLKTENS